jgi:hypothetical protein
LDKPEISFCLYDACQQISSEKQNKNQQNVEEKSSTPSLMKFFFVRKIVHQPNSSAQKSQLLEYLIPHWMGQNFKNKKHTKKCNICFVPSICMFLLFWLISLVSQ